jgi:hypothetical protein
VEEPHQDEREDHNDAVAEAASEEKLESSESLTNDMEQQLRQLQTELANAQEALGERDSRLAAVETMLAESQQTEVAMQREVAAAHRRALLAEHASNIVPELVQGSTVEELDASVDAARSAYVRALEAARAELASQVIPVGAMSRTAESGESLSPLDKIAHALRRL